jgi:hypothetical protein
MAQIAQSAGWWWPFAGAVILTDRPDILSRDDQGRLHSLTGPAIRYRDGWGIYAVHGVRVTDLPIERPEEITVAMIDSERNTEMRRILIDRYKHGEEISGASAYIRDAGGKILDHDERYGTLRRREIPDDEPIVTVEVVNGSREPDGSFKRYWLRVNPECRPMFEGKPPGAPQKLTALNAVASTYGMRGEEYRHLSVRT